MNKTKVSLIIRDQPFKCSLASKDNVRKGKLYSNGCTKVRQFDFSVFN